jgi:lipopolysaccharide transport system permease protein
MEATQARSVTVIEPQRGWGFPDLREIWEHRDLVYFLARRDIVTRYRQAVVGTSWVLLQPILLAAVFTVFLSVLQKVQGPPGVPYSLFAVTGMVLWLAFAGAVQNGSLSATSSEELISKIYLPRAVIPISAVLPSTVDFLFGFLVLVGAAILYGFPPDLKLLTVPFIWGLALMTALGFVLWFSALNVKYRDVGQVVPFLILVGLFVSPILYPFDLVIQEVPSSVQILYALNPVVGLLEMFHWALLDTEWPGRLMLVPIASSIFLLVTGALYFKRAERDFADYI